MAEWLRRWTRNPMGFSRAGSNPAHDDFYFFVSHFCFNIVFCYFKFPYFEGGESKKLKNLGGKKQKKIPSRKSKYKLTHERAASLLFIM